MSDQNKRPSAEKVKAFVQASAKLGSRYLAYGGPTSRLEEQLYQAGKHHNIDTEVFATPTGVFISSHSKTSSQPITLLDRAKNADLNLSALARTEVLLDQFSSGLLSSEKTLELIEEYDENPKSYPLWVIFFGALIVGFGASFSLYGLPLEAFMSGLLNIFITWFFYFFLKGHHLTGIFKDFLASFSIFSFSAVLAYAFQSPPEVFALGALIILVPGLTITTAISEIADHNFVSGNVKMMKGLLTLVAMGVAYLLVQDLSHLFLLIGSDIQLLSMVKQQYPFYINLMSFCLTILGSCLFFNVPLRAIWGSVLTGLLGWSVVLAFSQAPHLQVIAPFLASFVIGVCSLSFGRLLKLPSQIFSLPGILPLVPGLLAFSSFHNLSGQALPQEPLLFLVTTTSGSIVFGLLTARIPFRLTKNISN